MAPAPTPEQVQQILRILDVNSNRCGEGLRVIEEYLRFVQQAPFLCRECKQLRHDLSELVSGFEADLTTARDSIGDVGRTIKTAEEYRRSTPRDVAIASLNRVEQALRCLEEYGKLLRPELASRLEQLRYRSYALERAVVASASGQQALGGARLYVLIDGANAASTFAARAEQLVDAGVDVIQLRDKRLDDRELLQRAGMLRELTRRTPTLMLLNDRPDLACLSEADGVHLGQEDVGVTQARRIVGSDALIGVSTHSLSQAQQAVLDGANYIGVGPTFPSNTKQFEEFPGLELLTRVAAEIGLPAFAIGGIGLPQVDAVLATGMQRIAVGAAICGAEDLAACVARFQQQLKPSSHSPRRLTGVDR